ncbi:MAG: NAD-dependent epimerase/dehydratase family protein [Thermoplasmatota archaeon]
MTDERTTLQIIAPGARFRGARVYITGATGYIGERVVRKLVAEGADVTALARPSAKTASLRNLGVTVVQGDVRDARTIDARGHDYLIHAAAWVGFGVPKRRQKLFWETNVTGTRNVLEAARRGDVPKIVHVSSVAALGATGDEKDATEETPRAPHFRSLYEKSKTASHRLAMDSGLHVALPMPSLVVGTGSGFDPLFKRFVIGKLPALPKGDAVKGWVHIDDTAEGVLLCALRGKGPYLLSDENLAPSELFARLSHVLKIRAPKRRVGVGTLLFGTRVLERLYHSIGKTPPISTEVVGSLTEPMRYDSSRARNELGWRPDFWGKLTADLEAMKPRKKKGKKGGKSDRKKKTRDV